MICVNTCELNTNLALIIFFIGFIGQWSVGGAYESHRSCGAHTL